MRNISLVWNAKDRVRKIVYKAYRGPLKKGHDAFFSSCSFSQFINVSMFIYCPFSCLKCYFRCLSPDKQNLSDVFFPRRICFFFTSFVSRGLIFFTVRPLFHFCRRAICDKRELMSLKIRNWTSLFIRHALSFLSFKCVYRIQANFFQTHQFFFIVRCIPLIESLLF